MTNTEGSERYNVAVFEDGRREPWAKESPACLEIGIAVLGGLDYRAPRTEKQCTLPRKSPASLTFPEFPTLDWKQPRNHLRQD